MKMEALWSGVINPRSIVQHTHTLAGSKFVCESPPYQFPPFLSVLTLSAPVIKAQSKMVSWGTSRGRNVLDYFNRTKAESSGPATPIKTTPAPLTPPTSKRTTWASSSLLTPSPEHKQRDRRSATTGLQTPPDTPEGAAFTRPPAPTLPDSNIIEEISSEPSSRAHELAPLESQNSLAPPSPARAQARAKPVKKLVKVLSELRVGSYQGPKGVTHTNLKPAHYRELLAVIEGDEALNAFFRDRFRSDNVE